MESATFLEWTKVQGQDVSVARGLVVAGISAALWMVTNALYNIVFHPLRHVPGPFLAKFTTKWLEYLGFTGNKTRTLHEMHLKYGPAVRVAPNEVLFSDPANIKKIYGFQATYLKTSFYTGFDEPGKPVLFTIRDRNTHRDRKRLMAHAFTESTMLQAEPLVAEQVEKFLQKVDQTQAQQRRETTAINVYVWFRALTLDIVTSLFMGNPLGAMDRDTPHPYMDNVDNYFLIAGLKWQIPWLIPLTSWIPWSKWQHFLGAQGRIYEYGRDAFREYIERYGRDSNRKDALRKIIHGDKELPPLSDEQIGLEVGSVLVAGTDTTATVLTYLCWELAVQPSLQIALRAELKAANLTMEDGARIPRYAEIKSLPLLEGTALEGLRLHGPAVGSLPRMVPKGGDVLDGYFLPEGTTVGMQAYTLHHDESLFPDSNAFRPERWANGGTQAMKDASLPWSKGSRMCPGLHLATLELKTTLAALILGWDIGLGERMKEDTMDMVDHWVLMPKGQFCDLKFQPLRN